MKRIVITCLAFVLLLIPVIGVSCDSNDSADGYEDNIMDTTPPVISGTAVSDITSNTATVSWNTDEQATGNLEYGPDTGYGCFLPSPSDTSADKTSHSLALSGLSPDTTYHFRIRSADDAGNEAVSESQTFTTVSTSVGVDNVPPVISGVTESDVTDTRATITWTTDEAATSQVEYGTTHSYGSSTVLDDGLVDTHSVNLTGLTANTNYHYRVRSKDAAGNEAVSDDHSFYSQADMDMGKIVFCSNRDCNQEIYIMNANGTNQTRLTYNSAVDSNPQLSPDGQKIVFDSDRCGNKDIYVMNVDGSNQTRLTDNIFDDTHPAWSPDGTEIVFDSIRSDSDCGTQIWIMKSDGSNPVQLTFKPEVPFDYTKPDYASDPSFSADGTRIAFTGSGVKQLRGIWTINTDGSDPVLFAQEGQMAHGISQADWSPDSSRIVLTHYDGLAFCSTICTSDGGGSYSKANPLTDCAPLSNVYDNSPSYSPDGSKIAFCSNRDGNNEVYVMNADGSGQTRITCNTADDSLPSWGPTAVDCVPDTNTVIFPDANLEAAIREAIGKPQANIYQSDLVGLTCLNDNRGIADLTGIEHCTSLTEINIWFGQVSDLTPLSYLTSLTWLNLRSNQISDLTPLSSLTGLTALHLRSNQINDITPLSSLTNLTSIVLNENQISDLSPLSSLTGLNNLVLMNNNISDIEPLLNNPGLGQGDSVSIYGNPLSCTSINTHIPALEARGVSVTY